MSRSDPIPFDTHRFVKRLTQESMPAGQAQALADEQVSLLNSHLVTKQDISNLATKDEVAKCATKEQFSGLDRRINALTENVAVLKSDVRTLKWVVAGVGFGMLTVMLGVSSVVIKLFWTI